MLDQLPLDFDGVNVTLRRQDTRTTLTIFGWTATIIEPPGRLPLHVVRGPHDLIERLVTDQFVELVDTLIYQREFDREQVGQLPRSHRLLVSPRLAVELFFSPLFNHAQLRDYTTSNLPGGDELARFRAGESYCAQGIVEIEVSTAHLGVSFAAVPWDF